MEEQIIEFETAKLAKEKGFVGYGHMYNSDGDIIPYFPPKGDPLEGYQNRDTYFASTHSLLQKWLREEHDILVLIDTGFFNLIWKITIPDHELPQKIISEKNFNTYEKALEEGLKHALTLIK